MTTANGLSVVRLAPDYGEQAANRNHEWTRSSIRTADLLSVVRLTPDYEEQAADLRR
jgi:hypothetical protein